MNWLGQLLWDYVSKEWSVIRQVRLLFSLGVILFGGVGIVAAWIVIEWHHAATDAALSATIGTKDGLIATLQEELKGAAPELAAVQSRRKNDRQILLNAYVQLENWHSQFEAMSSLAASSTEPKEKENQFIEWDRSTFQTIMDKFGPAAATRYLDADNTMVYYTGNSQVGRMVRIIDFRKKAIETLIESAAYDK